MLEITLDFWWWKKMSIHEQKQKYREPNTAGLIGIETSKIFRAPPKNLLFVTMKDVPMKEPKAKPCPHKRVFVGLRKEEHIHRSRGSH